MLHEHRGLETARIPLHSANVSEGYTALWERGRLDPLAGDGFLSENEFGLLARVIASRRQIRGFLLTAWVFLPHHWHAILYPRYPLRVSEVMETIKVSATRRINRGRLTLGPLWL